MPALCNGIRDPELSGRRAVNWWWYTHSSYSGRSGIPQARNQGYRGIVGHPHTGWTVRVSQPRRRFAQSLGNRGARPRKTHRVRDQLVGEHAKLGEVVRMTRYLCGAYSWESSLSAEPPTAICVGCEVRHAQVHTVRAGAIRPAPLKGATR